MKMTQLTEEPVASARRQAESRFFPIGLVDEPVVSSTQGKSFP